MLRRKQKEGKRIVRDGGRIAVFSKVAREGLMEKVTFEPRREGGRRWATWMWMWEEPRSQKEYQVQKPLRGREREQGDQCA